MNMHVKDGSAVYVIDYKDEYRPGLTTSYKAVRMMLHLAKEAAQHTFG